jgi:hypothetical protein
MRRDDRKLLGRLTTKGLDVRDAPRSFRDVDALFALLQGTDKDPN